MAAEAARMSSRRVPLLDLNPQNNPLRAEIDAALGRVISSQRFILGPDVAAFEQEMATYLGVRHALGCASGSDALVLALMAAGVGAGDAVIVPPFTFFATAGAVWRVGATPIFADILPETFNLDPAALEDAARRHPRVKAVIPVHLFGGSADMDPILACAAHHGWTVIEDAAQSVGANYKSRRCCGIGQMATLSFFPSKNLGAFGDAGMVLTNDDALAQRIAALRVHGEVAIYHHEWIGFNSRMDTLQAAIMRVKLPHLDGWTEGRQRNATAYRERLVGKGLDLTLPCPAGYQTRHVWNQFVVRSPRRDELKAYLTGQGIGCQIYYPIPLHLQHCFAYLGYREGEMPVSERACREVLALPVHGGLSAEDFDYVCRFLAAFCAAT
jgi:dTDP-4-amino-4,6-dideoxygalactose transaminase